MCRSSDALWDQQETATYAAMACDSSLAFHTSIARVREQLVPSSASRDTAYMPRYSAAPHAPLLKAHPPYTAAAVSNGVHQG